MFTFECNECDNDFEVADKVMLAGEKKLKCPECGSSLPVSQMEAFAASLDDLLGNIVKLNKKFKLSLILESDALPPPYDSVKKVVEDDDDALVEDDEEVNLWEEGEGEDDEEDEA